MPPKSKTNNLSACFPYLVIIIAAVVFWYRLIFTGETLFFDLTTRYFYPMASILSDSIRRLELPFWNPYIFCGTPFLANPQNAVFYPFSYLFAFLSFPAALNAFIVLHTVIGGILMYKLAEDLGIALSGALLASFIFVFNGFFVLHAEFNSNIAAYVWLPGIVLYFRRYLAFPSLLATLKVSLALSLQFFAGYPGFFYYTLLFLLIYYCVFRIDFSDPRASLRRFVTAFAVLAVMVILFTAVQVLPAVELALNSDRGAGLSLAQSSTYSISPHDFLRFLLKPLWDFFGPFYTGDVHIIGFYFSLGALALCLFNLRGAKKKEHLFLLCGFLLFSLLSLGSYLPVYQFFFSVVPGWKFFRFPAQTMFLGVFCYSILAGYLLENAGTLIIKTTWVVLIAAELFAFNIKANRLTDGAYYSKNTPVTEFLKKDRGLFRFMLTPRTAGEPPAYHPDYASRWLNFKDMLYPNTGAAEKLSYVDGYETMEQRRPRELLNNVRGPSSKILALMNMKYLLSRWAINEPGLELVKDGYVKIYVNTRLVPRFFFAARAVEAGREAVIKDISSDGFDPKEIVYVENFMGGVLPGQATDPSPMEQTITVNSYGPNRIILSATAGRPAWLVSSETYYPGWKAEIDGVPAAIFRADYNFRAIYLPAGAHSVRFYYSSTLFNIGCLVSLSSLILVLLAAFLKPSMKLFYPGETA